MKYHPERNDSAKSGEVAGDRVSVALGETLGRHLSMVDSDDRIRFTRFLQIRRPGIASLQRSAMLGFGEDHTHPVASHP